MKIGQNSAENTLQGNRLVQEIHVSSPTLKGHKLEILVLEMDPPTSSSGEGDFAEAVLVPTMEIPTSNTGRYTPVTTPVHKSLLEPKTIAGVESKLAILNATMFVTLTLGMESLWLAPIGVLVHLFLKWLTTLKLHFCCCCYRRDILEQRDYFLKSNIKATYMLTATGMELEMSLIPGDQSKVDTATAFNEFSMDEPPSKMYKAPTAKQVRIIIS